MTPEAAAEPITIQKFLLGNGDLTVALQASDASADVRQHLGGFAHATMDAAVREVGEIGAALLDRDIGQVLLDAWAAHRALVAAGERTLTDPGGEEIVDLGPHQVTLDDEPEIDVVVNGSTIATITLTLSLEIQVKALTAVVRKGRLVAVTAGPFDVDASIKVEGQTVARREAQLHLPIPLPVGSGIDLTVAARPAAELGRQ
jgi:hypothetical protein